MRPIKASYYACGETGDGAPPVTATYYAKGYIEARQPGRRLEGPRRRRGGAGPRPWRATRPSVSLATRLVRPEVAR